MEVQKKKKGLENITFVNKFTQKLSVGRFEPLTVSRIYGFIMGYSNQLNYSTETNKPHF